jgi:hypothetical protein
MKMKMARYCLILLALVSGIAQAQNPNLGTSGAQFLQIPVGARETAMGGAVVANVHNAAGLFWNPAGIVAVPSNDLFFAHTPYWATISLNHAALVHTFADIGSFGASVTMLTMDPMDVTTELQPNGTGEQFDAMDVMIGLSYARRLTEEFSVGVTAKYVRQRIWNESAGGVAFDVGTQFRLGVGDLTIGMSLTNFGGDMRYAGEDLKVKHDQSSQLAYNRLSPAELSTSDYPLPLNFQVGVSMTVLNTDLMSILLAADFNHPNDNDERVNVGADLKIAEYFSLRGGYRFGYDQESATVGAGVAVPLGDAKVMFDYAFAFQKYLPDVQRITVGCAF